jgi:hypothetical protein
MLAGAVLPFWLSCETQKLQALIPGTLIPIKQLGTLHFTSRLAGGCGWLPRRSVLRRKEFRRREPNLVRSGARPE